MIGDMESLELTGNKRLLVADDEPEFCEILQEVLEARGFDVDVAFNGIEALEKLDAQESGDTYAVLIADINMPEMTGIELIRQSLTRHPFTVPVIVTGFPDTKAAVESLRVGAYDFISKPFKLDTIYLVIGRALEKHNFLLEKDRYRRTLESEVAVRTEELQQINRDLMNLQNLARETREILDLEGKIQLVRQFCERVLGVERFAYLPFDEETDSFVPEAALMFPHMPAAYRIPLEDITLQANGRVHGKVRLFDEDRSQRAVILRREKIFGLLYLGSSAESIVLEENLFNLLVSELEVLIYNDEIVRRHAEEMRRMFISSVRTHAHTIEAKDSYTKGHCERVEQISMLLAGEMGMESQQEFEFSVACILHDIGKIGVPEQILNKPGKLTEEEQLIMNRHPEIGGEIVRQMYGLNLSPVVRHHHEWFDGSGYPDGLSGEKIPLGARIIAVADAFDAMTTSRPYREGRTFAEALAEVKAYSGRQFDPNVVKVFCNSFDTVCRTISVES